MGSINKAILYFILSFSNLVAVAVEIFHLHDNITSGTSPLWPIVGIVFFMVFGILWFHDGRIELKAWNERVEKDD